MGSSKSAKKTGSCHLPNTRGPEAAHSACGPHVAMARECRGKCTVSPAVLTSSPEQVVEVSPSSPVSSPAHERRYPERVQGPPKSVFLCRKLKFYLKRALFILLVGVKFSV